MKVLKLTDSNDCSKGHTTLGTTVQWGEGVTHDASDIREIHDADLVHCYPYDPTNELGSRLVALIFNSIHADFDDCCHLWLAEAYEEVLDDDGTQLGAKRLTTLQRLDVPEVTPEHRASFAILCASAVQDHSRFHRWADNWLNGTDRTPDAASVGSEPAAAAALAGTAARFAAQFAAKTAASDDSAAKAAALGAKAAAMAALSATAALVGAHHAPLDLPALALRALQYGHEYKETST